MIIKKQNVSKDRGDVKSPSVSNEQASLGMQKSTQPAPMLNNQMDALDIDNINFSQRQERRRGDRRRGYRRTNDRSVVSRAQEEADTIKATAAKEGYKAGIEKAEMDIMALRSKIADFVSAKKEVFEYIAPDILEISVEIAQKIIKREITQNPELILDSILDVMKHISKEESKITIKLNPSQADLVRSEIPEYISSLGVEAKITVIGDDSISEGGCILNTNNGIVDASIDTQIDIIKEALKGM